MNRKHNNKILSTSEKNKKLQQRSIFFLSWRLTAHTDLFNLGEQLPEIHIGGNKS